MLVQFTPGGVVQISLSDGKMAYGVMLSKFPYWAFYPHTTELGQDGAALGAPIFVVAVTKAAYSRGRWGKITRQLPVSALPAIPLFVRQDTMRLSHCITVDAYGTENPISVEDAKAFERSAVWSAENVEERLEDHFASRPNVMAEWLRVKDPR